MTTHTHPDLDQRVSDLEVKFDNLLDELKQTNAALANIPEDWHKRQTDVADLKRDVAEILRRLPDPDA